MELQATTEQAYLICFWFDPFCIGEDPFIGIRIWGGRLHWHFTQLRKCFVFRTALLSAAEGRGREIIERLPYMCASVRLCVRSSRFYINLNISFIYTDIFTKFAGNVYGYENLSLQNFSLILKNKMAAIANCLKIINFKVL